MRLVCLFLELTGLDAFVAASYGAQHKVSVTIEEAVIAFGEEEQARLADGMAAKQITVCQDETFHPQVCLVAIEPVSNFLLLEQYADDRKGGTWTEAMAAATAGLPIEIIQSTSDEGRGLLRHVKEDLGIHHSPDQFHVQHDLSRATSGALTSRKRQAEKALTAASQEVSRQQARKEAYFSRQHGPGRPPGFDKRIEQAQEQEREAEQVLKQASEHQERARQAVQEISVAYHPYDLETGAARSAEVVASSLNQCFAETEAVAAEANLSERCLKKIAKAKRVVIDMVATVTFFWLTVAAKIEALSLAPEVEAAVYQQLLPAIYLHLVAGKAATAEQRHRLQQLSNQLRAPLLTRDGPFSNLTLDERQLIESVALECAHLFQRSSSSVEGRNGQLSLRHHSLHRLSNRKLAALTVTHNYSIKRSDGSTAAQCFFGAKPRDLFEYLLDQVDLPGRSAQKRSQPQLQQFLAQAAA